MSYEKDSLLVGLQMPDYEQKTEAQIFESAATEADAASMRAEAMSIALTFVGDGDYTSDSLQMLLQGFVDLDGNEELSPAEQDHYDLLAQLVVRAFASLGASTETATEAVNGSNPKAAQFIGDFLSERIASSGKDEGAIISDFMAGSGMVLESTKVVVRGGKMVTINVPTKKRVASAAQKEALAKARTKAHTAEAKAKRAKSMMLRKFLEL